MNNMISHSKLPRCLMSRRCNTHAAASHFLSSRSKPLHSCMTLFRKVGVSNRRLNSIVNHHLRWHNIQYTTIPNQFPCSVASSNRHHHTASIMNLKHQSTAMTSDSTTSTVDVNSHDSLHHANTQPSTPETPATTTQPSNESSTTVQYLSFFKYIPLPTSHLSSIRNGLYHLFQQHQCRGRIYISPEGINAQMILPAASILSFHHALQHYTIYERNHVTNNDNDKLHDTNTDTPATGISYPYQPFHDVHLTLGQTAGITNYTADHVLNTPKNTELPIFDKLHIRVKHRLVQDGLHDEIHDQLQLHDFGSLLSPEEWHKEVMKANEKKNGVKLIDVRNYYESDVGRFENAIPLDITTFREAFHAIDKIIGLDEKQNNGHEQSGITNNERIAEQSKQQHDSGGQERTEQQPTVLAYCTGGIRCIKVGAYLRWRGIKNVKLLDGGINSYINWAKQRMHTEKEQQQRHSPAPTATLNDNGNAMDDLRIDNNNSKTVTTFQPVWRGLNFVFDKRNTSDTNLSPHTQQREALKLKQDDVIGKCSFCSTPYDIHMNCSNQSCTALFIQCPSCQQQYHSCCSTECKEIVDRLNGGNNNKQHTVVDSNTSNNSNATQRATLSPVNHTHHRRRAYKPRVGKDAEKLSNNNINQTNGHAGVSRSTSVTSHGGVSLEQTICQDITCPAVELYCEQHSTPVTAYHDKDNVLKDVLERCNEYAMKYNQLHMNCGLLVGQLLSTLIQLQNARNVLELGTFAGYSTAYLLDALPDNSHVVSVELQQRHADNAVQHVQPLLESMSHRNKELHVIRADAVHFLEYLVDTKRQQLHSHNKVHVDANVNVHVHSDTPNGAVLESANSDDKTSQTKTSNSLMSCVTGDLHSIRTPFDLIFIDANKSKYRHYVDTIIVNGLLSPNGCIVVDNTLWKSLVVKAHSLASHVDMYTDDNNTQMNIHNSCMHDDISKLNMSKMTLKMDEFNEYLSKHPKLIANQLPIRDGVTIIRWKR